MASPDVIVVGAGVLGLCTAAELAARGLAVTVIDPGGANASSIAAGMIAPAMECLVDTVDPARAALLLRARDAWPAFALRHELELIRDGARWRGGDGEGMVERLRALGFTADLDNGDAATPEDWRIEPTAALARLAAERGVKVRAGRAARFSWDGQVWGVADGMEEMMAADVVLAAGAAPPVAGLPASVLRMVEAVVPIRGQITRADAAAPGVIRSEDGYVTPVDGGALAGATMDVGRRDLTPDPVTAARQARMAGRLLGMDATVLDSRVGVRGATPDGLPLAGPSGSQGLHLALAPRRNGWLMGPLVARIVADGIEGVAPTADAAALDPLRFG